MAKQKTEAQIDSYNRFGAPMQWVAATTIGLTSAATTFVNLVRTKFHSDSEFRQGFALVSEGKNEELKRLADLHLEKIMGTTTDQAKDKAKITGLFEKTMKGDPGYEAFQKQRGAANTLSGRSDKVVGKAAADYADAANDFFETCKEKIDRAIDTPEFRELSDDFIRNGKKIKVASDKRLDEYSERMFGIFSKGVKGHTIGSWQRFKNFSNYAQRGILFKTAAALGVAFGGTMMVFNQLNTRDKLNEIDKESDRVDRKMDAMLDKLGISEDEIETPAEHRMHVKAAQKAHDTALRDKGHVSKVMASRAEAEASTNLAV